MLKPRLLEGQAGQDVGLRPGAGRARVCCEAPATSLHGSCQQQAQLRGALIQLISLPIWDATAEGLKGDHEAEPSLWLAKLSPGWHSLSRAVGVESVLAGTMQWSRAGTCAGWPLLPSSNELEPKEPESWGSRVLNLMTAA